MQLFNNEKPIGEYRRSTETDYFKNKQCRNNLFCGSGLEYLILRQHCVLRFRTMSISQKRFCGSLWSPDIGPYPTYPVPLNP